MKITLNFNFKKFDKDQRSSFEYWFNHWKAYNMVAWNLGVWQPRWLLHDIEKPWLKLLWGDYKRVQKWHKHHNKHHIFSGRRYGLNKVDWLAAIIDWECSRYTKNAAPRNAREEVDYLVTYDVNSKYTEDEREEIRKNCYPILNYLGL
jgi:hypothetical protein